ncbi:MAG: hypothetical protein KUG67_03145 [Proteobacteria bacterium]|nr:hypothetical protein [Pseudomonadota bacterium]
MHGRSCAGDWSRRTGGLQFGGVRDEEIGDGHRECSVKETSLRCAVASQLCFLRSLASVGKDPRRSRGVAVISRKRDRYRMRALALRYSAGRRCVLVLLDAGTTIVRNGH